MTSFAVIDGGLLEGGGQILRISSSLSAIINLPISIKDIRASRPNPGLRPQHLSGLELIRDISKGQLVGGKVNSCEVKLSPGKLEGGSFLMDTKTAGSISLLVQSALPLGLFCQKKCLFTMRGGTNVDFAPPIEYVSEVFLRILQKFQPPLCNINVKRRGYYPKGGGEIEFEVNPLRQPLIPIELTDRGKILSVKGVCFVSGSIPVKVAHSIASHAEKLLQRSIRDKDSSFSIKIDKFKDNQSYGNISTICLWAETSTGCVFGSSAIWKRNQRDEDVAKAAVDSLVEDLNSGSCFDRNGQDQILLFMALAKGKSKVKSGSLTLHAKTAIHFIEELAKVKFKIEEISDGLVIIECEGLGLLPKD